MHYAETRHHHLHSLHPSWHASPCLPRSHSAGTSVSSVASLEDYAMIKVYEGRQHSFGNLTWNLPNIPAPEFLTIVESKEAEDNEDCQRSHDGCRVSGLP